LDLRSIFTLSPLGSTSHLIPLGIGSTFTLFTRLLPSSRDLVLSDISVRSCYRRVICSHVSRFSHQTHGGALTILVILLVFPHGRGCDLRRSGEGRILIGKRELHTRRLWSNPSLQCHHGLRPRLSRCQTRLSPRRRNYARNTSTRAQSWGLRLTSTVTIPFRPLPPGLLAVVIRAYGVSVL
jgi:hypothetical protein